MQTSITFTSTLRASRDPEIDHPTVTWLETVFATGEVRGTVTHGGIVTRTDRNVGHAIDLAVCAAARLAQGWRVVS